MLSDAKIRQAKPSEKQYKLTDGGGLYLLIKPNGQKYWRMKYRVEGKEKLLAFGVYPDISLADARQRRDDARKLKANGFDPANYKREQKEQATAKSKNCFENIAREWHELQTNKWSAYYAKQQMQRLEKDIFPKLGDKPIDSIAPRDILSMARAMESREAIELAHRAVQVCGQVFNYAIITERAEFNPALTIRGALKTPKTNNYAHLSANELPEFLGVLGAYKGSDQTKMAIKLLMLTFVRTGELCGARWAEIDLEKAEWRIPAERMKMRSPHVVPLSSQAVTLLKMLKRLNGKWEYVFPGVQAAFKPICTNTLLVALYTMGFKDRTTIHGFRATASTILNESGLFAIDVIERQLAHQERSKVRAAYNHAEHLPERRKMLQWWADYLEKAGLDVKLP
ncbi:MAG: tyrosine-type recombinase/integrase [Rickettsiales bacterium]